MPMLVGSARLGGLRRLFRRRHPAVVALRCRRCRVWVTPRRFDVRAGTCRACLRDLSDGARW